MLFLIFWGFEGSSCFFLLTLGHKSWSPFGINLALFWHKFRVKTLRGKSVKHKHHVSLLSKHGPVSSISCLPQAPQLPRREFGISSPLLTMKAQMHVQFWHVEFGLCQEHQSFRPVTGPWPLLRLPTHCLLRGAAGLPGPPAQPSCP